ncbi:MAG: hypothetical protein IAE78_04660 [Myxococcus sp.]|nr:hypothetical protein [Myxococcus sp.]
MQRLSLVSFLVVVVSGCGSPNLCDPTSCAGCCQGSLCLSGSTNDACGAYGAACQACGGATVCGSGQCRSSGAGGGGAATGGGSSQGCSAATCVGCCFNDQCQPGNTASGCGKNGVACTACQMNQTCRVDQTCGVDPDASFRITPVSARVKMLDPADGQPWDAAASPPDTRVFLFCPASASSSTASTSEATDTYTPSWSTTSGACVMKARELLTGGFGFSAIDVDAISDDVIVGRTTVTLGENNFVVGRGGLMNVGGFDEITFSVVRQ